MEKKNEKRRPRGEKQEFHRRAVTFTVYEANGWSQESGILELAKPGNSEEKKYRMLMAAQNKALRINNI